MVLCDANNQICTFVKNVKRFNKMLYIRSKVMFTFVKSNPKNMCAMKIKTNETTKFCLRFKGKSGILLVDDVERSERDRCFLTLWTKTGCEVTVPLHKLESCTIHSFADNEIDPNFTSWFAK